MQENTVNILSINERIFQILDYYGDTRYKFSKKSGISESSILNIHKGNNKPSYDFIEKILSVYEAVNARWLLTGDGEMIDSGSGIDTSDDQLSAESCKMCELREIIISQQAKTIALLEDKISSLDKGKKYDTRQTG